MSIQGTIILSGLQELSNAIDSGQRAWVTFEANGCEHWLQCTPTLIRTDWPFSSSPAENEKLKKCFGREIQIEAWDADSYATFVPMCKDVASLVAGIDAAFRDLYELGADYTLTYKIENAP